MLILILDGRHVQLCRAMRSADRHEMQKNFFEHSTRRRARSVRRAGTRMFSKSRLATATDFPSYLSSTSTEAMPSLFRKIGIPLGACSANFILRACEMLGMSGRCGDRDERRKRSQRLQLDLACGPRASGRATPMVGSACETVARSIHARRRCSGDR